LVAGIFNVFVTNKIKFMLTYSNYSKDLSAVDTPPAEINMHMNRERSPPAPRRRPSAPEGEGNPTTLRAGQTDAHPTWKPCVQARLDLKQTCKTAQTCPTDMFIVPACGKTVSQNCAPKQRGLPNRKGNLDLACLWQAVRKDLKWLLSTSLALPARQSRPGVIFELAFLTSFLMGSGQMACLPECQIDKTV